MSRHHDKTIARMKSSQDAAGRTEPDTTPMTREQVEKFVRGFGMNTAQTKQIVDRWMTDQDNANTAGWESRADSEYYDQW